MVYAFLIHSLAPGPCRILYCSVFTHDSLVSKFSHRTLVVLLLE